MEQITKTTITFVVLVLVLFGFYYFSDWFSKTTGYVLGEDEKMKLAQCFFTKNIEFYRSNTCPDCDEQINIFGDTASSFLNIVSCESVEECPVGGVPAWKIGEKIYYGIKQFDELISISECAVK